MLSRGEFFQASASAALTERAIHETGSDSLRIVAPMSTAPTRRKGAP